MKIAYVYDRMHRHSYAGETVAQGFESAFSERNDDFRFFDMEKLKRRSGLIERLKIIRFAPEMIFTSAENIHFLPLKFLKSTKLVLWAPFYKPCDFEPQIHALSEDSKSALHQNSFKHDILMWSQHDEEINDSFFMGYQNELGLKFVQLLHAADHRQYAAPLLNPDLDFVWIGNIGHRINRYNHFITPLKEHFDNYLDFNEENTISPQKLEVENLYRKSFFAPNIHTDAQDNKKILLNERVFASTMAGGFQLCDNPLARQYFPEDELPIVSTAGEIIDYYNHFQKHPEERISRIKKMQQNILDKHTYRHRVETILSQF